MSMPKLSEPPSKVSIPFTHMILFIPFFKLSLTHSVSFNPILPFLYSTVLWFSIYFLFFIGWGSDEKAIIAILAHRNAIQRRHIRIAYEQLFQEDLIKRLESEISGHFEVLILIFFFFFFVWEIVLIILLFIDFIRYALPLQLFTVQSCSLFFAFFRESIIVIIFFLRLCSSAHRRYNLHHTCVMCFHRRLSASSMSDCVKSMITTPIGLSATIFSLMKGSTLGFCLLKISSWRSIWSDSDCLGG